MKIDMRRCRIVGLVVILAGVVCAAPAVRAADCGAETPAQFLSQSESVAVTGTTVSGDGSALPGVLVAMSGDGVNQKTVSDGDGAFEFTSVPPGAYSVVFKLKGRKKVKLEITVSDSDLDMGRITLH